MSLKAIEIQMALHRNDEAGIRQNQLQHKPEVDQSQLGEQAVKRAERERGQTTQLEKTAEMHIKPGDKDAGGQHRNRERKPQQDKGAESAEAKTPAHPFKGHLFDVSL